MGNFTVGPVRDMTARRVCTLAGLQKAQNDLLTLREINLGTETALRELEKSRRRAIAIDNMLLVLQFTKITCDAFIGLAAKFAGKGGEKVEKAYQVAQPFAEATGKFGAGQKIDKGKLVIDVVKAARPEAGGASANELLVKNGVFKVEAGYAVLNGDRETLKKSTQDYMYDLAKFTVQEGFKNSLDDKTGERVGKFMDFGKTLFEYNKALGEIFDEANTNSESTAISFDAQRMTFINTAKRVSGSIRQLEAFVDSCRSSLQADPLITQQKMP